MMPNDYGLKYSMKYYSCIISPSFNDKETPFTMVYIVDVMLPVKIYMLSWRHSQFNSDVNESGLRCIVDIINEIRDVPTHGSSLAIRGRPKDTILR